MEEQIPTSIQSTPKKEIQKTRARLNVSKKRKFFKALLFFVVVLLIAGGIFAYYKKQKKQVVPESPKDLQGQYRDQLPDLKKKAEEGGVQNLQDYAIAQYATGDAQGAEQTYKKQIEKGGGSALVQNNLGNALRDQQKFEEAIKAYEAAIAKDKTLLSAYYNMASVQQYSLRDIPKAIETYKRGIENNPGAADMQVLLGVAYEQQKDVTNAKAAYEEALKIKEDSVAAKAGLERLQGE